MPPPAQQNQSAQVQSPIGITALSTFYQTSIATPLSQIQATPNQVPAYTLELATTLYSNQILAYAPNSAPTLNFNLVLAYTPDSTPAPNLNTVPVHIPKPVTTLASSLVLAYGTNAVQPVENGYFLKKYEYQQFQAMYEIQAIVTTTTTKTAMYEQPISFPQLSKT